MAAFMVAAAMLAQTLTNGIDLVPTPEPAPTPAAAVEETEEAAPPLSPYDYLYATYPRLARRMDCVISRESQWDPGAVNRRSGAAGLAQFLLSTWLTTPIGAAGASRFNPIANIDGAAWLATNGGWQHWTVVRVGLC